MSRIPALRFLLLLGLTLGAFLLLGWLLPPSPALGVDQARQMPYYSLPFGTDNPFYPSELSTPDGRLLNWRAVPDSRSCGECHLQETLEWATSLHAISDKELIYDSSVRENEFASQAARHHGLEKGRWCEACHNPLGTLAGLISPVTSVQETEALEEGTSCIVCHTVNHAQPLAGNGALELDINGVFRYGHPALLAAAPSRHARDMRAAREQPLMQDSALCGACHTEIRPTSVHGQEPMNLQDTYDEWRRSPWARQGIQCQDCHMSRDPAAFVAALKRGERPARSVSHRFVGNNYLLADTSLPAPLLNALRGGSPPGINRLFDRQQFNQELSRTHGAILALLQEAAELGLATHPEPGGLQLQVGVKNVGAGHALPTGPLDQRHMWLEVEVLDQQGQSLFHQGAFDTRTGQVDPAAPIWIKEITNTAGAPERRHVLFDAERLHYPRKPIPAGNTDRVDYHLPLAPGGPYQIKVRLWYRLALQDILENIERQGLGRVDAVIPPVLLQEASLTVPAQGQRLAAKEQP